MKIPFLILLCMIASSDWVSSYFTPEKRGDEDANGQGKVKQLPEELPSKGTQQSDMKFSSEQQVEIDAQIEDNKRGRTRRKALADVSARWPKGIVPYVVSSDSTANTAVIQSAFDLWESETCIKFVAYTENQKAELGHDVHLVFKKLDGCWSWVGMRNEPEQEISIGAGCEHTGTIAHEIGHAIGFHHEQSRPDRDNYISVLYSNVQDNRAGNFAKYEAAINNYDVPYDIHSIMHYDGTYFSKTGLPTMITKEVFDQFALGQREYLSFYDSLLANRMYNCISDCDPQLTCENDGYKLKLNDVCKCHCKPGYAGVRCEEDNTATLLSSKCETLLTEATGVIQSPKYPANYDNNVKCGWLIQGGDGTTITLTFDDFDVEQATPCVYDSLAVYDDSMFISTKKLCGSSIPAPITSKSNQMLIFLTTDESEGRKGFSASYVINPCKGVCGGILSGDSGCLASPSIGAGNDDCTWTIQVGEGLHVALDIFELDLNCNSESLAVALSDDALVRPAMICDTTSPDGPIVSIGNRMAVRLRTDSSEGSGKFAASYRAVSTAL